MQTVKTQFQEYHTFPRISACLFYYLLMPLIPGGCVANNVDPDQMQHSVKSDLGLHFAEACLSEYLD